MDAGAYKVGGAGNTLEVNLHFAFFFFKTFYHMKNVDFWRLIVD